VPKEIFNRQDMELHREIAYAPTDEADKLKSHILGDSFDLNYLDIDKIKAQDQQLKDVEKREQ